MNPLPELCRPMAKTYIRIAGTDGWIGVRALQLPGKKRLKTDELLRGFKLTGECRVH